MKALCFSCSGCRRHSYDYKSHEKTERCVFLTCLINRLELIQSHMSCDDWQSFSGELHDRILPTADRSSKLRKADLEHIADGVIEQFRKCAENDKELEGAVKEDSVTTALPKQWREEQELRNQFHRLFRKLGDEEAARALELDGGTGYVKVPLFFCTDRQRSDTRTPADLFSTNRARAMSTGIVKVSLPDYHHIASQGAQLPYLWSHSPRRATGKSSNSPEMTACVVMDYEHHVRPALGFGGGPREAAVFVHGFDTDMSWSAKHMGVYAYKMRGRMPFFLYEWPSFQSLQEYGGDEANAMWTVPHFVTFLKRLMTSYGLEKVHVISHSLGTKVALYALVRLAAWRPPRGAARLGQLLLVAPDFDTGEFYEMQPDVSKQVERVSIYCSKNDRPLNLSRKLHGGHHRLGHFNLEVHVAEGRHVALAENVHVIDATGLDKSMAGHTYAFTHPGVMEDVCEVLRGRTERPELRPEKVDGFRYFRYVGSDRKASQTEDDVAGKALDTSES
ncbi:hypothetical protein KFL_005110100 [Klebsormidium nitens]|uniref:Alpha/beta-Hydrolases superfamily protein n=1 Tax=Klebsormidium nitens TaxID=105231 RepID=A0A1Y1IMI6_KLENI|nr:hypothetical protein KFL_005110100 [Klebsormidium nitens]|eukprot:GAQ89328.1 hypothetical protein KFL_005110100 [Klebsormidium nitens]